MLTPDRKPRLYDADGDLTKRWYIDFEVWDTDKGRFVRKQFTGMNKLKTLSERRRVSKKKLAEITALLAAGYTAGKAPVASIGLDPNKATMLEAVQLVEDHKRGRADGERRAEDYGRLRRRLAEYPALGAMPLRLVGPVQVLAFLTNQEKKRDFGPTSWNSYRNTLSSVFNYLLKLEVITRNPVRGVETRKKVASDKHQPYTEAQRQQVSAALLASGDAQLMLFISVVYYCFIRSGGELRLLRIGDLKAETIRVPGGTAKNSKAEHVAIPRKLEELITRHNLRSYPADWYVFTQHERPGPVPVGKNWFARWHRALLDGLGLTSRNFTVYGYKHTGAINLYLATKDIELVRRHCRHAHAGITATYLRGIGALHDGVAVDAMPDF